MPVRYAPPRPSEPVLDASGHFTVPWQNYLRTRFGDDVANEVIAEIEAQIAALTLRVDELEDAGSAQIQGPQSVSVAGSLASGLVQLTLVGDEDKPLPVSLYSTDEGGVKGWNLLSPNWVPNPYADYLVDENGDYMVDEDGNFLTSDDGFPISLAYGGTGGDYSSVAQNLVWASPDGLSGAPVFRALVTADLPTPYLPLSGGTMTGNIVVGVDDFRVAGNTTAASDTRRITITPAGTMSAARNAYGFFCGANHATTPNLVQIVAGTGSDLILTAGGSAVRPANDNAVTSGNASFRWSVVYAATGTINTSDAREKTPVEAFTESELAASMELAREIGTYQWLAAVQEKGEDARRHVGLTVQRAIEVMESHGLNPFEYGFICFDSWEARPEAIDEDDGTLLMEALEAGSRYSFRMDELLLFIAKGQDERLRRLEQATFGVP